MISSALAGLDVACGEPPPRDRRDFAVDIDNKIHQSVGFMGVFFS